MASVGCAHILGGRACHSSTGHANDLRFRWRGPHAFTLSCCYGRTHLLPTLELAYWPLLERIQTPGIWQQPRYLYMRVFGLRHKERCLTNKVRSCEATI